MKTPIIAISGKAGSGKSTAADYLAKQHNGVVLGLADPMKRFVMQLFEIVDPGALWGDSAARQGPLTLNWVTAEREFMYLAGRLLEDFGSDLGKYQLQKAHEKLRNWYRDIDRKASTIRTLLQTLGTEFGRSVSLDFWLKDTLSTAEHILSGGCGYSPTDGTIGLTGINRDLIVVPDARFRNEVVAFNNLNAVTVKIFGRGDFKSTHASEAGDIPNSYFDYIIDNTHSKYDLEQNLDQIWEENFTPTRLGGRY